MWFQIWKLFDIPFFIKQTWSTRFGGMVPSSNGLIHGRQSPPTRNHCVIWSVFVDKPLDHNSGYFSPVSTILMTHWVAHILVFKIRKQYWCKIDHSSVLDLSRFDDDSGSSWIGMDLNIAVSMAHGHGRPSPIGVSKQSFKLPEGLSGMCPKSGNYFDREIR